MKALYRLLGRYEHGCSLYYRRREIAAREVGEQAIADILSLTARQELNHARAWWSLAGFLWKPTQLTLKDHPDWGALGQIASDGISRRYHWARFFFKNQHACDFDWEDTIAFAVIGERTETIGYAILFWSSFGTNNLARSLCYQEDCHRQALESLLASRIGYKPAIRLIQSWQRRAIAAVLIALVEVFLYSLYWLIVALLGFGVGLVGFVIASIFKQI